SARLGPHRLLLARVDPHRLLHEERIALVEQVMRDSGHCPVSPERNNEIRAGHCQHLSVVCVSRHISDLGRSPCSETSVRILDSDQLDIRHGNEVAEVTAVKNPIPVADLNRGNTNGPEHPRRAMAPKEYPILTPPDVRREAQAIRTDYDAPCLQGVAQ